MEKWNENSVFWCKEPEGITEAEITLENYTEFEGIQAPAQYILTDAQTTNSRRGNLQEEDGYDCALCKNRGYSKKTVYYRDTNAWANVEYDCVCKQKRRIRKNMEQSGLKDMMENHRFDNFIVEDETQNILKNKALHHTAHYADRLPYRWFFAGGQSGAGKTHICTAISNHLIDAGKTLKYKLWREHAVKLKALVNDAAAYEKELREWLEPDVLYIDDFLKCGNVAGGTQLPTQADLNLAYTILDYRYKNNKAVTIISSEFYLTEILRMEQAVGSRIIERTGSEYFVNIGRDDAKNYRLKMMDSEV